MHSVRQLALIVEPLALFGENLLIIVTNSTIKCKQPLTNIMISEEDAEDIPESVCIGSWLVVEYNNVKYPGKVIISINEEDDQYQVKTLESVQYLGKSLWKWPHREDTIFYPKGNIIQLLSAPKPCGEKSRGAKIFEFSEQF